MLAYLRSNHTGSSFLWVLDPSLTALMNLSNLGMYTYSNSSTGRLSPGNESFTIEYGGGLVQGSMITETVAIAGLTFHNVSMGVANYTSPFFQQQPSIGLLGLGPQPTYAHALPASFPISKIQSFALDFKTAGSDGTASIDFGGIDHSKYEGQLAKAPLNSTDGHWAVDNVDFGFDNLRMNTSTQVILGAGFHINVPEPVAEAYYSRVPGAALDAGFPNNETLWLVPCDAPLPDLIVHIGTNTATVTGGSMLGVPVNASSFSNFSTPPGYCNPSIQNSTAVPYTLGFPFFADNYVVFDRVAPEVSWAVYK
ncbi:aspartic peptidase domain-containing protein [Usnea florida]